MLQTDQIAASPADERVLHRILEGTATETGERFFEALVQNLAEALPAHGAWVTEYLPERDVLRALAFRWGDRFIRDYEYPVAKTPCEPVIRQKQSFHVPVNVVRLFPKDNDLGKLGAVSYLGAPLLDTEGCVLGNLGVMDVRPLPAQPRLLAVFEIFAARAAAEHRRLHAEARLREREEKLTRLVDSAMDAIVELDASLRVSLLNPAAERLLGCPAARTVGRSFERFLAEESRGKLSALIRQLRSRAAADRSLWIPGGLTARTEAGAEIRAEATLARADSQGQPHYTLILRDVNDRLEAERTINSLAAETEYLREEVRSLGHFGEIIGQSDALLDVLRDVNQVAGTETTVLILGETGTGKELFARAIHAGSRRGDRRLVKVNCSAIPAALMESEFFGHEKGAFTGATTRREGRFALADGGTIFLDEIGDLSPDLQAKLLRVLQEGEFEPVGSSHTRRVDVRVIAATNRDLGQAVLEGSFRQDLYYRLNVFPLSLPPLRHRRDDIGLLADAFIERFGRQLGRSIAPLAPEARRRLGAYDWPGNVRELQNVIERAVITSRNGRLDLDRALPQTRGAAGPAPDVSPATILTSRELREIERQNIIRALAACKGRVAGATGAAARLGMKPSTLTSRLKALGVTRA